MHRGRPQRSAARFWLGKLALARGDTAGAKLIWLALAHEDSIGYYGVRARKGFVVLTGEVGTGKTMLVRCVLELLRRTGVAFAYVFNPSLSALEFIRYIAGDFGLPVAGKAKDERCRRCRDRSGWG